MQNTLPRCVRTLPRIVLPLLTMVLTPVSVLAQLSSAAVNGTVKDNTGAAIPKAVVVLQNTATSVERRKFDASGNVVRTHGDYPAAMRDLAEGEGVALLDVEALSLALWQELGVEETKRYFNWTPTEQDNTHFNPPGAIAVARLVAGELLHRHVLARRDVRRLDEEIPESWITWS